MAEAVGNDVRCEVHIDQHGSMAVAQFMQAYGRRDSIVPLLFQKIFRQCKGGFSVKGGIWFQKAMLPLCGDRGLSYILAILP